MRALPQYEDAIRAAGGEPVIIDVNAASNVIAQRVKTCDGVLLPGSPADVDPEKYGAARHPQTAAADAVRDNTDELLLQDAYNMRKPIFGICYGLQSLNVWRTGTLDQDLPPGVNHEAGRSVVEAHNVQIEPTSKLASILRAAGTLPPGESARHYRQFQSSSGRRRPRRRLAPRRWSPTDNVKEAFEGTAEDHFVLCVQWHPERTYEGDAASRAMFQAFIRAAAEWHKKLPLKQQDFESVPGKHVNK